MSKLNTHNVIVEFGKHRGEKWTNVPIGYLKWILNEMPPTDERYQLAESELERRGDTMPRDVVISAHAIDKASLRVRRLWHEDRGQDEGLYSWLVRIAEEVIKEKGQNERMSHKGVKLVFDFGNFFPTVKTVLNDKKYKLRGNKDAR